MLAKLSISGSKALKHATKNKKRSDEIDKQLEKDKQQLSRTVKILLLGAGGSGKSTVMKQMRLMYTNGFDDEEREEARELIFYNLIEAHGMICNEMRELGLKFEKNGSYVHEKILLSQRDSGGNDLYSVGCLDSMKGLWADNSVQKAMKYGNEHALHTDLKNLHANMNRFFTEDYLPTDKDMLHLRVRTTGIIERKFEVDNLIYHVVDVGGQRSERRKWEHCFEGVHCILFIASLSGYDECLVEDKNQNQMEEAFSVFQSILKIQWLKKTSLILLLNKLDLFTTKLPERPIKSYFPDYSGAPDDAPASAEYFAKRFRSLSWETDREIYIHYSNATDGSVMKVFMDSVKETIIKTALKNTHLL